MPGVHSRENRGMISSPKDLESGTHLLPGRICAAMRHHCRELNTPPDCTNFFLADTMNGSQSCHLSSFTEYNVPKKLHQMNSAEMPKPSEQTTEQRMCIHPGNQTTARPSLKSDIVPSIAINNHFSVSKPVGLRIYILATKIIFKL